MRYLIILFLFTAVSICAQKAEVTGKVIDGNTGKPLYLANVIIEKETTGTSTDENGFFTLSYDINNDEIIRVSYIGYETEHISIISLIDSAKKEIKLYSRVLSSQTILVKGSIGEEGITPITFSKIKRQEIEDSYVIQDLPEYLSYLPSTTFYSESGNGIGYNYLSIRGFDQRRISISVNGIPQNDPEDHNLYWIDLPDILESTEMIQVQRGAGTGVIGYPAIGGSINIITSAFSNKPKFELSASIGSYNTRKYSASFSSGLINNKYSIYAKLSKSLSSGYRDNSWIDYNSYHLAAVRYDENLVTQINIYGGPISDGLAYYGIPKSDIKDKELRKTNYIGVNEVENFSQPHFELLNEFNLSDAVTFNSALFLVIGKGYFDYDGSWGPLSYFRITPENGFEIDGNPDDIYMQNTIIRAMVENKQWGWIPRVSIKNSIGELMLGGEIRIHSSLHWGSIEYADGLPDGVTKDFRYYSYEGGKDIFNIYAHQNFNISEKLNGLAELQVAYHNYKIENEEYLDNEFEINNIFFNPRIGLNYKFTPELNSYLAFARVTREPRLKNYYDAAESSGGAVPQFSSNDLGIYNFDDPLVKPETMNNLELGTTYAKDNFSISLNLYYMLFDNEIVKKGQVDRFGQPITGNMNKTVHSGIEISGAMKLASGFEIVMNGSYSNNYISEGKRYLSTDEFIDLRDNPISGFPEVTFNAILKYRNEGFLTQIFAKYVGNFYSDNYGDNLTSYLAQYPGLTGYDDNKVDAYFVVNIMTSYEFEISSYFKSVKLFAQLNNIFDNLYAAYAVGGEFFPAAERNFLVGMKLGL